jgi:hypothetical protein
MFKEDWTIGQILRNTIGRSVSLSRMRGNRMTRMTSLDKGRTGAIRITKLLELENNEQKVKKKKNNR